VLGLSAEVNLPLEDKVSNLLSISDKLQLFLWKNPDPIAPKLLERADCVALAEMSCIYRLISTSVVELSKLCFIQLSETLNIISCLVSETNQLASLGSIDGFSAKKSVLCQSYGTKVVHLLRNLIPRNQKRFYAVAAICDPRYRNRSALEPFERLDAFKHLERNALDTVDDEHEDSEEESLADAVGQFLFGP
jgi:hypothetical protein